MLRANGIIQLCVIALLALAVVMVNSANMSVGAEPMTLGELLIGRTAIYALLAVGVMFICSRINVRSVLAHRGLTNPVPWLLGLSVALCGVALIPGVGANINGSNRWLFLGPRDWGLTFQPSELAKWSLAIAVAWWCARRSGVMRTVRHGLGPAIVIIGLVCGLVVIEDLGTAVLIGGVAGLVLIAGGARIVHLLMLCPVAGAAVVGMIWHSPYRVKRLLAFTDPWADPQGIGYHAIQSMTAIVHGNRGLGNGIAKQGYLPTDTSDFLFAVICEELGVAGAGLVIGLYIALLWAGLLIIRDCRFTFGRLLGLAILLTVGLQAVMNIAVVTVVVPTKGIALPLLSAGGTGWVMTAAGLGLLAAIDRANRQTADSPQIAVNHEAAGAMDHPLAVSISASTYQAT
jgi:cell division protein FtsW